MNELKADVEAECQVQGDWIAEVRIFGIHAGEVLALDGEQVLCAEVESQAFHLDFL